MDKRDCYRSRSCEHRRAVCGGPITMRPSIRSLIIMTATTLVAASTSAQTAREVRGPTPLIAIENEAPPKLIVDPPLPEPLSHGRVYIQYRTENLRIVPVFGKGAL